MQSAVRSLKRNLTRGSSCKNMLECTSTVAGGEALKGVTEEHDQFSKNPEEIRLEGGVVRGLCWWRWWWWSLCGRVHGGKSVCPERI